MAEGGGEFGEWGGHSVEGGEGFFFGGAAPEASLGAGDGEGLQGLEHLAGQAATASGEASQFGELGIALLRPLGRGNGVATGFGDLGEISVVLPDILQAEGFADLASFVGVVFGCGEVAEAEMDAGELAEGAGFVGFVTERLPGTQSKDPVDFTIDVPSNRRDSSTACRPRLRPRRHSADNEPSKSRSS